MHYTVIPMGTSKVNSSPLPVTSPQQPEQRRLDYERHTKTISDDIIHASYHLELMPFYVQTLTHLPTHCCQIPFYNTRTTKITITPALNIYKLKTSEGTGTFRSHALSFPGTKRPHSGRFVPGNESVDVSFPEKKLPSNICFHELSSPTTVATRYSMHHYELFNYDYRVRLK